ncbi:MAG TPA: N(4)-(beta-N-acetylglucosaminyl)-L-asparaginase [Bacteroidia bacterium]|nr:N(4)-(beta-N-acetylglucosaminyl)-L-asparaginase [Bacteroidia bacterium]
MNRKSFLTKSAMFAAFSAIGTTAFAGTSSKKKPKQNPNSSKGGPLIISTWSHGMPANEEAMKVLLAGGSLTDSVEKGVMVVESDKNNTSVGLGGFPDRDGIVTLDASIMDEKGNAGSASFVQGIEHPISLARAIMEKTPHVMLVGSGAEQYARELGMKQLPNALTDQTKKAWQDWLKEKNYKPVINIENHDTIGLLSMDANGNVAGSCTTSGLAWKMHGRIGDSPVIGAGLFVDNEVGGSACTGLGETVLRTLASHLAVEKMRDGATPQEACEEAINRIVKKHSNYKDFQVGIIAVNKLGEHGAYGLQKGFNYALHQHGVNKLFDADYFLK